LLIGASYFFLYSGFLKVNEFKVEGTRAVDKNTLFALFASEIIKNQSWRALFGQDNLIFWLGAKSASVKERIPLLAELALRTNIWEQRVEVNARERQFNGIWCFSERRQCFVFDKDGVTFSLAPTAEGALLLKITDESERSINLGQSVLPERGWLAGVFTILEIIKKEGMAIADIRVKELGLREWEIVIAGGPRLIFNFEYMSGNLAEILKNLRGQLNFSKLQYIDLRVPGRIYYK
jgi:hypothetical protein